MMHNSGYVSGSITRIRKKLKESPDQVTAYKSSLKDTVAFAVEDFDARLRRGEVKIDNVSDFEKLAKLGMLLYGEATEKVEHVSDVEETTTLTFEMLKDSQEFEALKERLNLEMNKQNENG